MVSVGWDKRINIYSDSVTDVNIHHVQHPNPNWSDDLVCGIPRLLLKFLSNSLFFFVNIICMYDSWLHFEHCWFAETRSQWGYPLRGPVSAKPVGDFGIRWWGHRVEHGLGSHLLSLVSPDTQGIWGPVMYVYFFFFNFLWIYQYMYLEIIDLWKLFKSYCFMKWKGHGTWHLVLYITWQCLKLINIALISSDRYSISSDISVQWMEMSLIC